MPNYVKEVMALPYNERYDYAMGLLQMLSDEDTVEYDQRFCDVLGMYPRHAKILTALMRHPETYVSYNKIRSILESPDSTDDDVRVHISQIRRSLEDVDISRKEIYVMDKSVAITKHAAGQVNEYINHYADTALSQDIFTQNRLTYLNNIMNALDDGEWWSLQELSNHILGSASLRSVQRISSMMVTLSRRHNIDKKRVKNDLIMNTRTETFFMLKKENN